jgi:hypothetical protein
MRKEIPFVAFGNDELIDNEDVGEKAICPKCGKKHIVKYGTDPKTKKISKIAGFVACGKESYLVSIKGKII